MLDNPGQKLEKSDFYIRIYKFKLLNVNQKMYKN